jgi:PliI/PliC-like inhibitor of I-type lysozyme
VAAHFVPRGPLLLFAAALAIALLLPACAIARAEDANRYVALRMIGAHQAVVVAEGDLEPRSMGSYSVRLYQVDSPQFVTDKFVAGLVRPRDGTVRSVALADIGCGRTTDLIVIIQSAGSGGYLAADAFAIGARSVHLVGHVEGLPPAADIVAALRKNPSPGPADTPGTTTCPPVFQGNDLK